MAEESTLYQHGTLALLVPGLLRGTQSVGELMQHGDTGIGTLTGLDGELIMAAGTVYQVNAAGQVRAVAADERVPFANVHRAAFEPAGTVKQLDYASLRAALAAKGPGENLFYAVRVHGTFQSVTTRAVAAQTEPYPTLTATAAAQSVFTQTDNVGTLSGYFAPKLYAGAAVPGFHLHYLSDAHDFGGHVLDAVVADATVELQVFTDLQLHLPADDADFRSANLDQADLNDQIAQAEQ